MADHSTRASRTVVYGSARIRWLRRLARRPVTTVAFAACGLGAIAATLLSGGYFWWLAAGALALPLVPSLFVVVAVLSRESVVLRGKPLARAWAPVHRAYLDAERFVPAVRDLLPGDDPAEVLRHARMAIARLMADRQRLEDLGPPTIFGAYGLAPDDPLRAQLAERHERLEARIAEIDAELPRRIAALTDLVTTWGEFVYQRDRATRQARAAGRAARTLTRADQELIATAAPADRPDEASDLAERSSAVLTAYRELLGLL